MKIIFIVETDCIRINSESDYEIDGYNYIKECFVTILKVLQNTTTITSAMNLTYLLRVKL